MHRPCPHRADSPGGRADSALAPGRGGAFTLGPAPRTLGGMCRAGAGPGRREAIAGWEALRAPQAPR